ncbi:MAG TPA: aspartyl protease family protein [Thermoanaerobaculia bacterium]|nr:aspartyl protease family protein [Thermoanaerobaculia bacterium]
MNPETIAVEVPFHLAGGLDPLILVPASVNGEEPHPFILDTGAGQCLLSPVLAGRLGIEPESERQARGAGGPLTVSMARVRSLAVGSAREEDVQVAITGELARIGTAIRARVEGVLGFNFLQRFRVELDYAQSVLRLVRPLEPRDEGSGPRRALLPFHLAAPTKPLVLVPVFVDGEGPFQFALDTGASRTMLAPDLVHRLGLQTVEDDAATGAGGAVQIVAGTVTSLAVGEVAVRDHAIGAGEFVHWIRQAAGVPLDGILGYNFLNQFRVTIDYPRSVLELTAP